MDSKQTHRRPGGLPLATPSVDQHPSKQLRRHATSRRPSSKVLVITGGIVLIGGVWFAATHQSRPQSPAGSNQTPSSTNNTKDNGTTAQAAKTPTYPTILPAGKSIDQLGGWKRVSPPKNDPVYAYNDQINGVAITVSQQQAPQSFKQHAADQTAELAKKFNATTKLTAGDTIAYLGSSSKGPQSVILTKKNLLILIKSQKKIDNNAWVTYIKTLN